MPNLWTLLRGRRDEISRYDISQYLRDLQSSYFQFPGTTYGQSYGKREDVENSFVGYVNGGYKRNSVIFAIILSRLMLFTEARFMYRHIAKDGSPGELFGDDSLSLLRTPWPNGTTGELLARMEQDVSLAGNAYIVNEGDRLRRLRPDWVSIILSAPPEDAVQSDVIGYGYHPGGYGAQASDAVVYLPDEVCHWSPIPDPTAQYRGMSWLTPGVEEIQADSQATTHKLNFFRNGASPQIIATLPRELTKLQFTEFRAATESAISGTSNAYKIWYLGGGADAKIVGSDLKQLDFRATQGAGESRLCALGGVPPIIVGLSEGLASATYSNYGMARRKFGDHWARPQWRSACAALATITNVPEDAELWYDDRDIAFLREDQKDAATIQQTQMATINSGITAGYEPGSVRDAVIAGDWKLLQHSGLVSVQLNPPGAGLEPGVPPVDGAPTDGALPPVPPGFEPDATVRALNVVADLIRATQSSNDQGGKTLHEPPGSSKGGQFTANPGGGGSSSRDYHSVLPADSAYGSGGGGGGKKAAPTGTGIPAAPGEPRTMKSGDSGEDVRYAQYALSLLGFNVPQDGHYDRQTEASVKEMQSRLGVKKPNGHLSSAQLRKLQDAVRLSPCIGRSDKLTAEDMFDEIMRAFEVEDESVEDDATDEDLEVDDLDEAELDDEPASGESENDEQDDEMSRALVEAFELLADETIDRAGHDVSGQLRVDAGFKGGGQFRSLSTRLVALLKDWRKGDGPDDPLAEFSQPQLKKAAEQLGLNPPKGMKLVPLKALILDHARAQHRESFTADQERKQSAKFSITHNGKRIDVAVFTDAPTGKKAILREVDDNGHPGRVITSQPDLAGLDKWADDRSYAGISDWAHGERTRGGGPAKAAPQAAPDSFEARAGNARTGEAALAAAAPRRELSPTQVDAVEQYGIDTSFNINAALREGDGDLTKLRRPEKHRPIVEGLDSAMEPLSSDVVVYRRLHGEHLFGSGPLAADLTGHTFTDPGFVSTSTTERRGSTMVMRILAPKGTPAISHSHLEGDEIVLGRGQTFRVVRDHGKPGGTIRQIDVEVVPTPAKPKVALADDIRDLVVAQRESGTSTPLDADLAHLSDDRLRELHAEIAGGSELHDRTTAKRVQEVLDRRAAKGEGPKAPAKRVPVAPAKRTPHPDPEMQRVLDRLHDDDGSRDTAERIISGNASSGGQPVVTPKGQARELRQYAAVKRTLADRAYSNHPDIDGAKDSRNREHATADALVELATLVEAKPGPAKRVPAKKAAPAAAKVAKAGAGFDAADVHARLLAATSREQGREILSGLSLAQLREVSPGSARISKTKPELIDNIVGLHVGSRLQFAAIRERGPDAPGGNFPGARVSAPKPDRSPLSAADRGHHIVADPSLTNTQKRNRLRSMGMSPDEVDSLVPAGGGPAKVAKAAVPRGKKAEQERLQRVVPMAMDDALADIENLSPAAKAMARDRVIGGTVEDIMKRIRDDSRGGDPQAAGSAVELLQRMFVRYGSGSETPLTSDSWASSSERAAHEAAKAELLGVVSKAIERINTDSGEGRGGPSGFSHGGLTASLDTPGTPDARGRIAATGQIRNGSGAIVGGFEYHLNPADHTAHVDSLALGPEQQGNGFGSAFAAHIEDTLRGDGYKKLTVDAAYGGGDFWAGQGYGWDHSQAAPFGDVPTRISAALSANPDGPDAAKLRSWLDRFDPDKPAEWPTPKEIHDAGPVGRGILNGANWRGEKSIGAPTKPTGRQAAKAAAPKVDRSPLTPAERADHIVSDPDLSIGAKRSRLKSAGFTQFEIDLLVPLKSAKAPRGPAKAANPAEILSSLPADLTPAQRRARLRSRGVSKAEIDALVPLAKLSAAEHDALSVAKFADGQVAGRKSTLDLLERKGLIQNVGGHLVITDAGRAALAGPPPARLDLEAITARLSATHDVAGARDALAGLNLVDLRKVAKEHDMVVPAKATADQLRQRMAELYVRDRGRFTWRSQGLDAEDLTRSEGEPDEDLDDTYDDEPSPLELEAMAAEELDEDVARAAGHDVTPGHDELHHYWTRGEGLAKWIGSPHQFTTLHDHLIKYVTPEQANRMAAAWVHEVTGAWPGSDVHRVEEGGKPRGHRIGPG